jgi:hypothetical protein
MFLEAGNDFPDDALLEAIWLDDGQRPFNGHCSFFPFTFRF